MVEASSVAFKDLHDEVAEMFACLEGQTSGLPLGDGWTVLRPEEKGEWMREARSRPAYRAAENERERARKERRRSDPVQRAEEKA